MPRLSMRFLGGYQVQLDGEPVTTLEYDKVRALLAYLAMEADRPRRREALVGLLWPDLSERRARHNLSQALWTLRRALGDESSTPVLTVTPGTIQLNPTCDHWLDVRDFTSLLTACQVHRHWRLETCLACAERLDHAIALYSGPFLDGLSLPDSPSFEQWQLVWRERLHHEATGALRALAHGCDHRGERDAALRYAERWVAMDPWHEGAHRQLMRALALSGRRTEALAEYESCRTTLQEELGVDPAQETADLYHAIRDGAALPPLYPPLPHNLPAPATPFVGREGLLNELSGLLQDPDCRLVTLVGPGGSGKTRLALQAGAEAVAAASDCFADGAYFVPLGSLRAADSVGPSVAQALGYTFQPGQEPVSQLLRALRRKRLLLILDNYEHLLDGSRAGRLVGAGAVAEILGAAPGSQVLVTSRARLNVLAERVLPVGGMAFPPAHQGDPSEVRRHSAVALFLDRVRSIRPTHVPDGQELGQVGRICRLVEGMPLAILLAASWIDVLSPGEIADRVATNLDLLAADLGDLPARQRSMRAVFDASWATLSEETRSAFARMSVFRGGFTAEAAQAVAGADLGILRELVRTSFLQRTEAGRFEIHELLCQYGSDHLGRMPADRSEALDRHCAYYAAFYRQRAFDVWSEGIASVASEISNIQAAWHCALDRGHVPQICAFVGQSNGGLHQLYYSLGWTVEGEETFARAVAVLRAAEPSRENELSLALALRYHALCAGETGHREARLPLIRESIAILSRLGVLEELAISTIYAALFLDDPNETESIRLLQEGLAMAREAGCTFGVGWASNLLGDLAVLRQAYQEGEEHQRVALEAFRRTGHQRGASWVVASLARLAYYRDDYASARALAAESMAVCEQIGWTWRVIGQLLFLGEVSLAERASDDARTYYQEALVQAQDIGDDRLSASACCGLGDAALARHDRHAARAAYRQAFDFAPDGLRDELGCRVIHSFAAVAARDGRPEEAATLVGLAHRTLARALPPLWEAETWMELRLKTGELYAELQRQLPPSVFAAAEERARSMSLHATVAELLAELAS
jgi:DNA-binding SARP family transcriptional activator/predicted ATPase